jgi:hypothetical protein
MTAQIAPLTERQAWNPLRLTEAREAHTMILNATARYEPGSRIACRTRGKETQRASPVIGYAKGSSKTFIRCGVSPPRPDLCG